MLQSNVGGGFLLVGSSNADRSATALREEGNFVNTIKISHWKPKPEAVAALTDHVREALRVGQTRVLVFQLFDNLLYLGRQPDGTTSHAVRDPVGRYHVVGDLVVAGKEAQYNIFKSMNPALLAAASGPIIFVTPMPRYIFHGCCDDPTNLSNRGNPDFASDLQASLAEARVNLRSFAFSDNIHKISVIDPAPLFDNIADCWDGSDPVHPTAAIYRELAKLINRNAAYLLGKQSESSRNEDREDGGLPAKRREWDSNSSSSQGGWSGPRGGGGRRGGGPSSGGGYSRFPRYA